MNIYKEELLIMQNDIVEYLLEHAVNKYCEAFGEKIISIICSGSIARNEYSIFKTTDANMLFSDLDLLIVLKNKQKLKPLVIKTTNDISSELKSKPFYSPFFKITASVCSIGDLKRLPRIFRNYETKESGKVIYGKNVLNVIPQINIDNIDNIDLNRLLIERLYQQYIFNNQIDSFMYKSFFLCRNILEIPSILLPHIGILKPSYAERVNFFGKSLNILYKIAPFTDWNKINESIKYSMKIKMNPSILKGNKVEYNLLLDNLIYSYMSSYIFVQNVEKRDNIFARKIINFAKSYSFKKFIKFILYFLFYSDLYRNFKFDSLFFNLIYSLKYNAKSVNNDILLKYFLRNRKPFSKLLNRSREYAKQ